MNSKTTTRNAPAWHYDTGIDYVLCAEPGIYIDEDDAAGCGLDQDDIDSLASVRATARLVQDVKNRDGSIGHEHTDDAIPTLDVDWQYTIHAAPPGTTNYDSDYYGNAQNIRTPEELDEAIEDLQSNPDWAGWRFRWDCDFSDETGLFVNSLAPAETE